MIHTPPIQPGQVALGIIACYIAVVGLIALAFWLQAWWPLFLILGMLAALFFMVMT